MTPLVPVLPNRQSSRRLSSQVDLCLSVHTHDASLNIPVDVPGIWCYTSTCHDLQEKAMSKAIVLGGEHGKHHISSTLYLSALSQVLASMKSVLASQPDTLTIDLMSHQRWDLFPTGRNHVFDLVHDVGELDVLWLVLPARRFDERQLVDEQALGS